MATTTALFIPARASAPSPEHDLLHLFGGFSTVADTALSHLMEKLKAIQQRWPRLADVLQRVVDIKHETRRAIPGGASISKAYDLLRGYAALPRKSRLSKDWSDFRDVAHLIAAAAEIAFACRKATDQNKLSAVLTPVLLVPEVVVAFGIAYQEFGLSFKPHGQRNPILSPETLWHIPSAQDASILPLPVRRLSDADLDYLTKKRRAPKRR
jgi:hypothetical protein